MIGKQRACILTVGAAVRARYPEFEKVTDCWIKEREGLEPPYDLRVHPREAEASPGAYRAIPICGFRVGPLLIFMHHCGMLGEFPL